MTIRAYDAIPRFIDKYDDFVSKHAKVFFTFLCDNFYASFCEKLYAGCYKAAETCITAKARSVWAITSATSQPQMT